MPTRLLLAGLLPCLAVACGSSEAPEPVDPEVVIGVPAGEGSLDFVPLEEGGALELGTFNQGGRHVTLAIRAIGLGARAFVSVTIERPDTGAAAEASTPPTRPMPLLCRDEHTCDLVPFLVMTGPLRLADGEADGLPVRIDAVVRNADGAEAIASQRVVLSAAELDAIRGADGGA